MAFLPGQVIRRCSMMSPRPRQADENACYLNSPDTSDASEPTEQIQEGTMKRREK
ncbi:hypothetical protein RirG_232220 [Rhizophagus irregularis DAOM 197198w]|uniref:Uncharacterized protein n=1 Tax=Rhizophagus irregularis (strain DAOM 197198w) TaxID=1432141 RepID=A0A015LIR2_RHIIW|nr:hypothetical protein RirG_232220 [Rhizophagus irregularis DAOM 197198w]EXX54693.1 hypothetical protein RirG_232220 [Rhizophagus irregularis DAOM 197198w]